MKHIIKEILDQIQFSDPYIALCNKYNDYDGSIDPKRSDVETIIQELEAGFDYVGRERLFRKEYPSRDYIVTFMLTFKSGLIEPFYYIRSIDKKNRLNLAMRDFAEMQVPDLEKKVKYKVAFATSTDSLKAILQEVFRLHHQFIKSFEQSVDRLPRSE
jgi:hypothetical protein